MQTSGDHQNDMYAYAYRAPGEQSPAGPRKQGTGRRERTNAHVGALEASDNKHPQTVRDERGGEQALPEHCDLTIEPRLPLLNDAWCSVQCCALCLVLCAVLS